MWRWRRFYDGAARDIEVGLGRSHSHPFAQVLKYNLEGLTYLDEELTERHIPWLAEVGDQHLGDGVEVTRTTERDFVIRRPDHWVMRFGFGKDAEQPAKLLSIEMPFGTARCYYEKGLLTSIALGNEKRLLLTYQNGLLQQVHLEDGIQEKTRLITYEYDQDRRLTRCTKWLQPRANLRLR